MRIATWEYTAGKGIDDLLIAGGTYTLERYTAAAPGVDAVQLAQVCVTLSKRYVALSRDHARIRQWHHAITEVIGSVARTEGEKAKPILTPGDRVVIVTSRSVGT